MQMVYSFRGSIILHKVLIKKYLDPSLECKDSMNIEFCVGHAGLIVQQLCRNCNTSVNLLLLQKRIIHRKAVLNKMEKFQSTKVPNEGKTQFSQKMSN